MSHPELHANKRLDAKKNHLKVLAAADRLLAERGLGVCMEDIAQDAGVGIGTLYRHFPTKEVLIEAVLLQYKQSLVDLAQTILRDSPSGEGFFALLQAVLTRGLAHRGMVEMLQRHDLPIRPETLGVITQFWQLTGILLDRAQAQGRVRGDVCADDIKALVIGLLVASHHVKSIERVSTLMEDALRAGALREPKHS